MEITFVNQKEITWTEGVRMRWDIRLTWGRSAVVMHEDSKSWDSRSDLDKRVIVWLEKRCRNSPHGSTSSASHWNSQQFRGLHRSWEKWHALCACNWDQRFSDALLFTNRFGFDVRLELCQVRVKLWQVRVKLWQVRVKLWQVRVKLWQVRVKLWQLVFTYLASGTSLQIPVEFTYENQ